MRKFQAFVFLVIFLSILTSCGAKRRTIGSASSSKVFEHSGKASRADVKSYYADLLATNPKNLNADLYEYIDEWMGSPHRLGGQQKDGIDCSGFVGMLYQNVYRKNLPRSSRNMAEVIKRKYDDQLKEGDLVFFSFGGKAIDHVGIYLHNDRFVHVSTKLGVVISNLKDTWYYKYLTRCGTPEI